MAFFSSPTEATVELSLDNPRDEGKKDVAAQPAATATASSLSAAASLSKPQLSAFEEVNTPDSKDVSFSFKISRKTELLIMW